MAFVLTLFAALAWAQTAGAAGPWHDLQRPVDLPSVGPGESCPVSPVDESVYWPATNIFGGSGTGPGPVYPGLGGADPPGHVTAARGGGGSSWFGAKVFWYAAPSYRDRVLIRGRRLDAPGKMAFAAGNGRTSRGLRIRRKSDISWSGQPTGSRGAPSGVLVRSPGCYGAQIDGTNFSRTVVFTVSIP